MYEYRVSVTENFGRYDENEEEVAWGPYSTTMRISRPIQELDPLDVVSYEYRDNIEDVFYGDDYLMFDVIIANKEAEIDGVLDDDSYIRYNYLVTDCWK